MKSSEREVDIFGRGGKPVGGIGGIGEYFRRVLSYYLFGRHFFYR